MEVRFIFKSTASKPSAAGKVISHVKRLPVVVGRADAPEIKLHIRNDSVSRRHCELLLDEQGRVCVRDLESTNGTTLNGRPLKPRVAVPLDSGSRIKLGEVGFRIEYAEPSQAASSHDSDTIPINEAAAVEPPAPPDAAAAAGPPLLEPDEPPAQEPAAADEPAASEPAVDEAAAADEEPADDETAPEGDFGFLEAEAPQEAEPPAWPEPPTLHTKSPPDASSPTSISA